MARAESIGTGRSHGTSVDRAALEKSLSYLSGASILFSRRFHEIVGAMREDYFLYCEEVEWCLRAKARGMRLGFAPNALVVHDLGTTPGAGNDLANRPRLPLYLGERNKILVTRDCFPARLPLAAMAALVLLVLTCGRRGAWRQLGYGLAGWWAGLCNRRGTPAWLSS
jgi:GT2 family glycosyltransferase